MSRIVAGRCELVPLTVDDADDMVEVLSDPALYTYIGGAPPALTWLRERYARLVVGHSPDGRQQWHNWIVRRTPDARAVGTVQATVTDEGRQAEIAWIVGAAFQGSGLRHRGRRRAGRVARRARRRDRHRARAPEHQASMAVARRAGLRPTDRYEDGERVWIRPT